MAIKSNHSAIRRMRMRGDNFTQVSNDLARDLRLSRRARGLFVELASHKEGWQTSIAKLAENGPEGIHAIRVAIAELETYGYLVRVQVRDPKTKQVVGTEYWITNCPEEHIPSSEPLSENPSSAELTSEDRTPYKKTIPQNTNEKKTRSEKTPGSFANAQEPAAQPAPTQETLDGTPAPTAPLQLTVLPGGHQEPNIDQQARDLTTRYWEWLKTREVPPPAALGETRGRGTPYVKLCVVMVKARLKHGWTPDEISHALGWLFEHDDRVFPPASVLDRQLLAQRRGRTAGRPHRSMYSDEQWNDPGVVAGVEAWNRESAYGRARQPVPAMTDEELQAAWDELGAPRRGAHK